MAASCGTVASRTEDVLPDCLFAAQAGNLFVEEGNVTRVRPVVSYSLAGRAPKRAHSPFLHVPGGVCPIVPRELLGEFQVLELVLAPALDRIERREVLAVIDPVCLEQRA